MAEMTLWTLSSVEVWLYVAKKNFFGEIRGYEAEREILNRKVDRTFKSEEKAKAAAERIGEEMLRVFNMTEFGKQYPESKIMYKPKIYDWTFEMAEDP